MADLAVAHVASEIAGGMRTYFRTLLPEQARRDSRLGFFVRRAEAGDLQYLSERGVQMRRITDVFSLIGSLREYDVVNLHSADLLLLVAGVLSGRPTVFTLHGLRVKTRAIGTVVRAGGTPKLSGLRRRVRRSAFSFIIARCVTRISTPSRFLAGEAASLYGLDPAKVDVVYNGLRVDALPERQAAGQRARGLTIGWMGRLVPVKRVDLVIHTLEKLRRLPEFADLRAVLVGDGPLRGQLEDLSVSLGVREAVDFIGFTVEPQRYLRTMDLFVLPSRGEGLSYAVSEALAIGVPVIVLSDGGGAVELVRQSGGGLVVADPTSLAATSGSLLRDGDLRNELGLRGRRYASEALDVSAWALTQEAVYRRACGARGQRRVRS